MDYIKRGAVISKCGKYRYVLSREWKEGPACMFIGLNPSTADASEDDPTIRRCVRFADDWGYGRLYMLNLFAYRATQPKVMMAADDPIGPNNDEYLIKMAEDCGIIIAAWGNHGALMGRDWAARRLLTKQMHHLGLTKSGQPKHPLYLKADTKPILF